MSRKKRPTSPSTVASPNTVPPSSVEPAPVATPRPAPPPQPARPNKWFLAASIALLAGWIGFLLYLALHARHAAG